MPIWAVVLCALGSAAGFGLAGALQHTAMARQPTRPSLRPGLVGDLVERPLWIISIGATAGAWALQIVALAGGTVTMVQPLLISGLLFAVLFRSLFDHRRPRAVTLGGAALCVAGLAAFLALARPSGGTADPELAPALLIGVAVAAVLAACIGLAAWRPGRVRSLTLALGGGLLYGTTATVAKVATGVLLQGGLGALFVTWPLYVMAVLGPGGFLLTQHAYRAHRSLAPAQAVITLADPLVGITLGLIWLQERVVHGAPAAAGEALGLAAVAGGVWLLARHAASGGTEQTANEPDVARSSPAPHAP